MSTIIRETEKKIQAMPGNTQYPGIRKTTEGLEFTLEVMPGKKAFLMLYRKGEDAAMEIPFPEESRKGRLISVTVTGVPRGEIRYNYRIDDEIIPDPYGEYICNAPAFGQKPEEKSLFAADTKEKCITGQIKDLNRQSFRSRYCIKCRYAVSLCIKVPESEKKELLWVWSRKSRICRNSGLPVYF